MELSTEFAAAKQQILIIDKDPSLLVTALKQELKRFDNDVYISPGLPSSTEKFDVIFIVNDTRLLDSLLSNHRKKIVLLFINKRRMAQVAHAILIEKNSYFKIISLENYHQVKPENLEKILWFSFSRSSESFLAIQPLHIRKSPKISHANRKIDFSKFLKHLLRPKKIILIFVSFIILFHTLFFLPLAGASFFNYLAVTAIKEANIAKTDSYLKYANVSLDIAKRLYSLSRPSYLVIGQVVLPDNIIQLNEKANESLRISLQMFKETSALTSLILKKEKTQEDETFISLRLSAIGQHLDTLENNLSIVLQKLPDWSAFAKTKSTLKESITLIDASQKLFPNIETLFAKNSVKNYLLLFANNMELRPGGGFIGSFAVLTLKNFSLENLKVYDVYDADGQLKAHIPPPEPISKYLHQPHWFLRDSSFSPDFLENYNQAKFFLERELNLSNFDGGILITTSAIQNILSATGNLYIPDFKENVNKDNFYIKAQTYAEKDFFPGSQQKKRFLSSVVSQLLISAENTSFPSLVNMIKKSLDEKQIVMRIDDEQAQNAIDSLYWSGRTLNPTCAAKSENCIVDYLFPVDANLGVNKANFFVSRSLSLNVNVDAEGSIKNTLKIRLKNDSANDVFPGGTYRNYLQVLIPSESEIITITKNGVLVENFDQTETAYKTIGFFLEMKPQTTTDVLVRYRLKNNFERGRGVYQLIVQKQIGSPNSDFNLTVSLPKNIYIVNQNFSPLVKDNAIVYNTNLTADKIFFIDLIRD